MMESGKIVEHDYRTQLEHIQGGRFARQIEEEGQEDIGKDIPSPTGMEWRASKASLNQTSFAASQQQFLAQRQHHRASRWAASIFPGGGWEEYMTDVVPVRETHIPNRLISREVMMASENLPNYPSPSVTRITHTSISSLTLTGAGSVGHHAKLRPLRLPQE